MNTRKIQPRSLDGGMRTTLIEEEGGVAHGGEIRNLVILSLDFYPIPEYIVALYKNVKRIHIKCAATTVNVNNIFHLMHKLPKLQSAYFGHTAFYRHISENQCPNISFDDAGRNTVEMIIVGIDMNNFHGFDPRRQRAIIQRLEYVLFKFTQLSNLTSAQLCVPQAVHMDPFFQKFPSIRNEIHVLSYMAPAQAINGVKYFFCLKLSEPVLLHKAG